jgi:RNA recognition motif-containing protein
VQHDEPVLTELFEAHGRVRSLHVARDLFSGECKGFAEVQMEGHEARAAVAALNGYSADHAMLQVRLGKDEPRRKRR